MEFIDFDLKNFVKKFKNGEIGDGTCWNLTKIFFFKKKKIYKNNKLVIFLNYQLF
jgi:hypothetical protein